MDTVFVRPDGALTLFGGGDEERFLATVKEEGYVPTTDAAALEFLRGIRAEEAAAGGASALIAQMKQVTPKPTTEHKAAGSSSNVAPVLAGGGMLAGLAFLGKRLFDRQKEASDCVGCSSDHVVSRRSFLTNVSKVGLGAATAVALGVATQQQADAYVWCSYCNFCRLTWPCTANWAYTENYRCYDSYWGRCREFCYWNYTACRTTVY